MHTRGTVPHLLVSDQTYLFNAYLVFILLFESSFFKSTLAAFPSTSNFLLLLSIDFFPHPHVYNWCLLYYTDKDTFFYLLGNISLFFHWSHLLCLPLLILLSILTNCHYFRVFVCFLSLWHSFCEIAQEKWSKNESILFFESREKIKPGVVKNW